MYRTITSLIFLLVSTACYAEAVDGPANIRSSNSGEVIFTLNNNARINVLSDRDSWYAIEVPCYVDKTEVVSNFSSKNPRDVIPEKTLLYDRAGKVIGQTKTRVPAELGDLDEGNSRSFVVINGYTHQQNIRISSMLESAIETKLNSEKTHTLKTWSSHISSLGYQQWIDYDNFKSFIVFPERNGDPSPSPRVILFFYMDRIFGIYHSKPIRYAGFISVTKIYGFSLHYIEADPAIKRKFDSYFPKILREAD